MVNLYGTMEINMKAISKMIKKKEMELIFGMMEDNIKDNGKIMNKMDKEFIHILIKIFTKGLF